MSYLNPKVVANAARLLFGTGHSESIVFFFLKAQGASTENWITLTSSNDPPEGLKAIAEQPEGFDELVENNLDRFSGPNNDGFPTRPGARGSPQDYSMFFPIAEETQYLLRKRDCNRNAVWSNITGGRNALNSNRAKLEDVFDLRDPPGRGLGKELRFKPDYVYAAHWYYGPKHGTPMRVPLRPLAVWMHRNVNIAPETSIDELVEHTVEQLHITDEENYLLFDTEYPFSLQPDDFVDEFNLSQYFEMLCYPSAIELSPRPVVLSKFLNLSREDWDFTVTTLGLRKSIREESPFETARQLIADGERNLLLYGPPRTGKSYLALDLASEYLEIDRDHLFSSSCFTRIQFHLGWSYGDFIRRIVPIPAGNSVAFRREDGIFLQHCLLNSKGKSVVVIDEINRANLAEVFGEAFQVIEIDYRGIPVELSGNLETDEVKSLVVPPDLLIIATANDLDRTTLPLDFAFLSRFVTIRFPVMYNEIFKQLSSTSNWNAENAESFVALLREIEKVSGYPIGHASFYRFGSPAQVRRWYETSLRPVLALYLTQYQEDKLSTVDTLITDWLSDESGENITNNA